MKISLFTAACCLSLFACASDSIPKDAPMAGAGATTPVAKDVIKPMQVLEPGTTYAGKSSEQWGVEYMRWFYSQATCENTATDQDGSLCDQFQTNDDVIFLDRADYSPSHDPITARPLCHIPTGKALIVPVAVLSADNAGMPPVPEELLKRSIGAAKDSMRDLTLVADGISVDDMDQRGFGPTEFDYHVPAAPNFFSCLHVSGVEDTDVKPSYLAGYFAIIAPPDPGKHELEYANTLTAEGHDLSYHVKVNLTVEDRDE